MYPQAKIRLKRHQTEPQSNTGANTPQDHGVGERKIRYSFTLAVIHRLTTCKPSPQEGQFINQQAKIVFDTPNKMPENHKCQHPTGPGGRGKTERRCGQACCALVGCGRWGPQRNHMKPPTGPLYHTYRTPISPLKALYMTPNRTHIQPAVGPISPL